MAVALRHGPYGHLNPAAIHDAILQVDESSHAMLVDSPDSNHSSSPTSSSDHSSAHASPTETPATPWVPFKVTFDEENDPETMLENLRVIFERRLSIANRIPENEWTEDEAKALITSEDARRPLALPVEGAMEQLRFLPMAPTKMNKELVRIRRCCTRPSMLNLADC